MNYEGKANAVVAILSKQRNLEALASDTPFRDFLTDLLPTLLPLLLGCFGMSASRALAALRNPSLLLRVRLLMEVSKALRQDEAINMLARPLAQAIWQVARDTTTAELDVAMQTMSAASGSRDDEAEGQTAEPDKRPPMRAAPDRR